MRLCIWVYEASESITYFSSENALITFDLPNRPSYFMGAFSENHLFTRSFFLFYIARGSKGLPVSLSVGNVTLIDSMILFVNNCHAWTAKNGHG